MEVEGWSVVVSGEANCRIPRRLRMAPCGLRVCRCRGRPHLRPYRGKDDQRLFWHCAPPQRPPRTRHAVRAVQCACCSCEAVAQLGQGGTWDSGAAGLASVSPRHEPCPERCSPYSPRPTIHRIQPPWPFNTLLTLLHSPACV
ncbi:hypothetical protein BDW02DRAFT_422856 [Decorospora gaudefroyi]|uniref:Uncharacterized protein n=1 Tax=Decorospora gaudefroyi TaxID=184978 RepID=A0A6A5KDP1_9PLEO|nr:hypothetical protein BDW02DRAFT_422856 [Decorospora gaudefroyi]